MPGLGKVTLGTVNDNSFINISFDESICGMLFDTSSDSSIFDGHQLAATYFADGQTVMISSLTDAEGYGLLDDTFMYGIPAYHIRRFYEFASEDAELYIMFMSCISSSQANTPDFSCIQTMQRASKGRIFNLGIWTEQNVWNMEDGVMGFTPLIGNIQSEAMELCGGDGIFANNVSPLTVILNANTVTVSGSDYTVIDFKQLPYANSLNCNKVTLQIGQESSDKIHSMQMSTASFTPVGMMGIALGFLNKASAEESIGYVEKYDINVNDTLPDVELGFGDVARIGTNYYTPLSDINRFRQNIMSESGYVFPTTYIPNEGSLYFNNDQTLSEGDFRYMSRNRVMSKIKRIIRAVMLPMVNGGIAIDYKTGFLENADTTIIHSKIIEALDEYLVNSEGQLQVGGRAIDIPIEQRVLDTDSISMTVKIIPLDTSEVIRFEDTYNI